MEQLVIMRTNLWIIENLGVQIPLKQLNSDNIHITKIPIMPMRDEEKKHHYDILWQQVEKRSQKRHKLDSAIPFSKLKILIGIFKL
jgi:hypothetical protein